MKRTYVSVGVRPAEAGWALLLDDQIVRTPAGLVLAAPNEALASAVAEEWRAQGEEVRPDTMPLTRLLNVALDRAPLSRAAIAAEAAKYAETDLVCHRADHPPALAARQATLWDPLLAFAQERLGARLLVGVRVSALGQPPAATAAFARAAEEMADPRLTGFAHAMGLTGSVVIALALAERRIDALSAFEAACVDELFQLDRWGEDAEARARLERMRGELAALQRWFEALG